MKIIYKIFYYVLRIGYFLVVKVLQLEIIAVNAFNMDTVVHQKCVVVW